MGVSGVAASVVQLSPAKTANAVAVAVPKKVVEVPAHGVMHLVQSASLETNSNPPHLGKNVDTFA